MFTDSKPSLIQSSDAITFAVCPFGADRNRGGKVLGNQPTVHCEGITKEMVSGCYNLHILINLVSPVCRMFKIEKII